MKEKPILSELSLSTEFYELCAKKYGARRALQQWSHVYTIAIMRAAENTKQLYDEKLTNYNANAGPGNLLFLTPNIKVSPEPNRTYLTIRWARMANGTYINWPSKPNSWTLRELPKRGRTDYSECDFESALKNKPISCLDMVMETEHIFRFLRAQYLLVGQMYSLYRKLTLPKFQELLVKHEDIALSEIEKTDRTSMIRQLEEHNPRFDPFYLPKAKALIQFHNSANDRFTEKKFDDCPF